MYFRVELSGKGRDKGGDVGKQINDGTTKIGKGNQKMSKHTKWSAWQNVGKQTFVAPEPKKETKVVVVEKVQPTVKAEDPKPEVPTFNLELETPTPETQTTLKPVKQIKKQTDGAEG